jgi:hypothetical protein
MTEQNFNNPAFNPAFEPTREDVLIGRVIDGEASSTDWDALDRLAQSEPAVWERLGRAQRAHARLEREVEDAIALAELIELPASHAATASLNMRFRQYSGWAMAAVLGLALLGSFGLNLGGSRGGGNGGLQAGIGARSLSPDEALDQYVQSGLASGRVLGEMPAVLVDARPAQQGGGQEVLFVRQILERKFVTDVSVMSVEMDEHGTARYVPLRQQPAAAPDYQRPF